MQIYFSKLGTSGNCSGGSSGCSHAAIAVCTKKPPASAISSKYEITSGRKSCNNRVDSFPITSISSPTFPFKLTITDMATMAALIE